MNSKNKYFLVAFLIAVPVIIYFFFLKWQTKTIYGDDLYIFRDLTNSKSFAALLHLSAIGGKFRPVYSASSLLIFDCFHKNLHAYFLFNIFIQTINTWLVALLLNLFLRRAILSVLLSLLFGLSRLAFYNISQLFNGGALEGLAMTFFLLSLLFILKAILTDGKQQKQILWAILFATLSMYTHERYIVLLPFVMIVAICFPGLKTITRSQKAVLASLALASILLNVAIKKYALEQPFFVGTGGTTISFSLPSAIGYLRDAVLTIFQINSGPDYLIGISFSGLHYYEKITALLSVCCAIILFTFYLFQAKKSFTLKQENRKTSFFIFLFLAILFAFCLVPAIITIRLEQRWLQASFSIFILMLAIAFSNLQLKDIRIKNVLLLLFIIPALWSNYYYLSKGADNLYMKDAEKCATFFKQATSSGIIHQEPANIYIWKKKNDTNENNGIAWAIGNGYLFNFYQGKSKKIMFIDSTYTTSADSLNLYFKDFNKDSTEVVYIKKSVTNITNQFLKDSLRNFDH